MYMKTFWSSVPISTYLTLDEVRQRFPGAVEALGNHASGVDPLDGDFAFAVIPNIGPGGATSEEDEEDLNNRDPDQEIEDPDGPSVTNEQALMFYMETNDELWLWNHGEPNTWLLWNY